MTTAPWDRVKALFQATAERPPSERAAFLAAAAGGDKTLIREVESLLVADELAGHSFEHPCTVPAAVWEEIEELDAGRRFEAGQRLGRYVVEQLIAVGGMGEVYRAHDTRLGRTVVLKVLQESTEANPDWRVRLEREARAVSRLNHPHVCALYDIGQEGDVDFLVLEHLEGETLSARLDRGALPIEDMLAYGVQILAALEAAHGAGVVHRDLKPANIMLTSVGAKLLDFGIAKPPLIETPPDETAPDRPLTAMTQQGARVGTAQYMAPEQVDGRPVDQRADIFAFGAVLYQMVTGQTAFAASDLAGVFAAVLSHDPPLMRQARRDVPRGLEELVSTCLAKDPDARYASATDVRRALERVAARRRRTHRAGWFAAAAGGVGAAGLVWALLTGGPPPHAQSSTGRIVLTVLPFLNQTGDSTQEYLSQGLTDELITEIGRLQPDRLGVIGRTSSLRYRETHADVSAIGRELGVDYFVEGSVSRAGTRVRILVRLVRASDHLQVWGDHYDRQLDDILALQADVARAVVKEIAGAISPEEDARLHARTFINPAAHEHYLKGRFYWGKRNESGLRQAIEEFEAATQKHPGYAAAFAGIADSYLLLAYYSYFHPAEALSRARSAATKALDLDNRLAEAHVSMAAIYSNHDHRWNDAEAEYLFAVRLNANYPTAHQWYANHLVGTGRRQEAQARILRARDLDPLSPIIQVNVANILLLSREYDRAIDEGRKALEIEPDSVTARWVLGRAYALKGQAPEAINEFRRGLAIEPENTLLIAALARTYASSGALNDARSLLRGLIETQQRRYVSALNLAPVYAALGQPDQAFASLRQAVDERANLLIYLAVDPDYDSLRADPRFREILRGIGLEDVS